MPVADHVVLNGARLFPITSETPAPSSGLASSQLAWRNGIQALPTEEPPSN